MFKLTYIKLIGGQLRLVTITHPKPGPIMDIYDALLWAGVKVRMWGPGDRHLPCGVVTLTEALK